MSSHAKSWEKIFKDDQFVKQYKTGEQVTGRFAQLLIDQSGMVADSGSDTPLVILDNGCGTGVVSSLLQDQIKRKMQLTCGDISQGMLNMVKARRDEEGWRDAHIEMVDAQSSGLPPSHFTHVIASFVFMALPSPLAALDDATRILRPGGTLAFSTWIEPGWLGVMHECIRTISEDLPWPTASQFLEIVNNGKWNSVEWIISELKKRGYEDINVRPVAEHVSLGVPQFEEMSMTMFSMVSKAFWTEQQRENHADEVRPAMKEYLETTYGCNGQIPMEWTAIMSTARKPN